MPINQSINQSINTFIYLPTRGRLPPYKLTTVRASFPSSPPSSILSIEISIHPSIYAYNQNPPISKVLSLALVSRDEQTKPHQSEDESRGMIERERERERGPSFLFFFSLLLTETYFVAERS
ncbi:hypothetical protein ACMFMF_008537 [Clarireedia jacksonii]